MLLKGKSNNWAILKYGVVAPILFLAVLVSSVSCSDVTIDRPVTIDILERAKVDAPPPPPPPIERQSGSKNLGNKPIFTAVEENPGLLVDESKCTNTWVKTFNIQPLLKELMSLAECL